MSTQTDTLLLEYDEGVQEDLLKHWKRYKLRMKLKLEDKSEELAVFATLPASIKASGGSFDYVVPENELASVLQLNALEDATARGGAIFSDPRGREFGVRAILPTGETCTAFLLLLGERELGCGSLCKDVSSWSSVDLMPCSEAPGRL